MEKKKKKNRRKKSAVKWREPPHSRLLALVLLRAATDLSVLDEGKKK